MVEGAQCCWAYPASKGLENSNIHCTGHPRHVVIEWEEDKKKLVRRECMQCSVELHAMRRHDITAFSDPEHAHHIITKSLKCSEKITDPPSGIVKSNQYTLGVSQFQLLQGMKCRDLAKSSPLPKDSLKICHWTNKYMRNSMLKEVFGNIKSKSSHNHGIFGEYMLGGGQLLMVGKLCVPDALVP